MRLTRTLLAASLLLPTMASADVSINIPQGVQLLTVNQEDAGYSSLGFDYKDKLTLNNGVNQVVFRIAKIVFESGSDKTKFKSEPLVLTFDTSDKELDLKIPTIRTFDQGMTFNSQPTFQLMHQNQELDGVKKDQLGVGFKLMPDMVQEVEKYNKSTEVASLKHFEKSSKVVVSDTTDPAGTNYTILKAAYENVSAEEKKKFLTWAISNIE